MLKLPNLTDITLSRITEKSLSKPQPPQRAFSISNLHSRRSSTSKPTAFQLRQNQLLWKFNRRKQKLIQTSVQNFRLYNRIKSQKSQLSKFNRCATRLEGSRMYTQGVQVSEENKENNDLINYIKKKQGELQRLLKKSSSTHKQWKKIHHSQCHTKA